MKTTAPLLVCALILGSAAAHSNLIYPKPRNAIDSLLPEWQGGKAPAVAHWLPPQAPPQLPCACANDTEICESAQTCLWFTVGTTIGCSVPDGGTQGGANPNNKDRCGSGMNATNNKKEHRTVNRDAVAFSDEDWTRWNPWRAPGNAPVYDPCGRASGGPKVTGGEGVYTTTKYAKVGDMGSQLPKLDSGVVWKAGSTVETKWSIRANHGGGYQYRLCKAGSNLTEECFQQTPMPFAGNSRMMVANGTIIPVKSTFVSEGTMPAGSTWQMVPVPGYVYMFPKPGCCKHWFEPPCYDPNPVPDKNMLTEGQCSGEWFTNITFYDYLTVPEHLEAGDYVLGFRWDCESSAQVWQSCADITIKK